MKNLILKIITLFVFLNFSSAAVGGAFGGAAGAIGGAVSEQMSAHLIDTKDAAGGAKIGLVAGTATMLTGGGIKDVATASSVASSAHEYNRRLHPDELKYLADVKRGKTPEEQEQYEKAALALTKGDKGVDKSDPKYAEIKAKVDEGKGFTKEQAELKQIAANHGNAGAFEYSLSDKWSDSTSKRGELWSRSAGGIKVGAGAATVLGSGAAEVITAGSATPLAWATFGMGSAMVADGGKALLGKFEHSEGASVLASLRSPVDSYAKGAAISAIHTGAEFAVLGLASKALPVVDVAVTGAVNKGLGALKAGPKVPVVKVQVSAPDVRLAQVSVPQQDHHAHKPGHRRHQAKLDAQKVAADGVVPSGADNVAQIKAVSGESVPVIPLNTTFTTQVKGYFKDLESRSGIALSKQQKEILRDTLSVQKYEPLDKASKAAHTSKFTAKVRAEEIKEWEIQNSPLMWPVYEKDIISKSGEVLFTKGSKVQAHHVIHQSHGGPHKWWNLFPLHLENHQKGIHLPGSFGELLHGKK